MDTLLTSIDYRDPIWIVIAFVSGLVARQIKLPPMIGFLTAGFILHALGARNGQLLTIVADLGVTLLLFTIGLKLRLKNFARPEIWATTSLHMVVMATVTFGFVIILGWAGLQLFNGLDYTAALTLAFALSFSSTVFTVKILEDRGSLVSRYGQVAIGVLVLQDIAAVTFLAISAGTLPSPWALSLLALIPARHALRYVMHISGNRELLVIFGLAAALGGAALFELVGLKGDLGALIIGVLLAQHEKADQLSKTLMDFKDVFLVCFFLTIGLNGMPSFDAGMAALILLVIIPLKTIMFTYLMGLFRMRARGATLGGLVLGNYSEFGLIVAATAVSTGLFAQDWLAVIALTLAGSLVISSILNVYEDEIYTHMKAIIQRWERPNRLPGDEDIDLGGHRILIFGMGRVGRAAYDEMAPHAAEKIVGIDLDEEQVQQNCDEGRNVMLGDATNPEFWTRLIAHHQDIEMVLLAMPNHHANLDSAHRMRERGYNGPIVAIALFPDHEDELRENGIDEVFNIYAQAGSGAATHMQSLLSRNKA